MGKYKKGKIIKFLIIFEHLNERERKEIYTPINNVYTVWL